MESSNSPIPMRWQDVGGSANQNPTWTTTSSAEPWGKSALLAKHICWIELGVEPKKLVIPTHPRRVTSNLSNQELLSGKWPQWFLNLHKTESHLFTNAIPTAVDENAFRYYPPIDPTLLRSVTLLKVNLASKKAVQQSIKRPSGSTIGPVIFDYGNNCQQKNQERLRQIIRLSKLIAICRTNFQSLRVLPGRSCFLVC